MKPIYIKILLLISIIASIIPFFLDPILQDNNYHFFADTKHCCKTPNFWNVYSNLPFVVFGIIGLFTTNKHLKNNNLQLLYYSFFTGILLTGFGSAYYHLNPNNETLVWDRLPMTISFMSFFPLVIGLFIDGKWGKKLLFPLLLIGITSVLVWVIFADLRMYILVQFLPILLLLLILILSKNYKAYKKYFFAVFLFYFFAKILETYDKQIYYLANKIISGHTLKHLSASLSSLVVILFIKKMQSNESSN